MRWTRWSNAASVVLMIGAISGCSGGTARSPTDGATVLPPTSTNGSSPSTSTSIPVVSCGVKTLEIQACILREYDAAEALRQAVLTMLQADLTELDHTGAATMSVSEAERAFESFRELTCDSVYTEWIQGSVRVVMRANCMLTLTVEHNRNLTDRDARFH